MADFLEIADERRTATKSSISQTKDTKLSLTNNRGRFLPISFKHLDYVDCGIPHTHLATVSLTRELDYAYPVQTCTYYSDKYIYKSTVEVQEDKLPEWFGVGYYKKYVDSYSFVNGTTTSLGARNKKRLQSGLHYVEAQDNI